MPDNLLLPPKVNQYYPLYGKKLTKKPKIKIESNLALDELYKQQYMKKIKKEEELKSKNITEDVPKKLAPVFGRTAYTFYDKNINRDEFDYNSYNLTTNPNIRHKGNIIPVNNKNFFKE